MNKEITKVESVETKDLLEKVAKIEELEFESRGLLETIPKPVPVPLKNQTLYSQEDMINLSMGKKGYFNIMAQKFREKPSRISTGIFELDEVTGGGWVNNGISVITAMPNLGKTTILLQSAVRMAQQGTAVVFISNDMRKIDLESRILAQLSYSYKGEDCLRVSDITNSDKLSYWTDHNQIIAETMEKTLKYLHIRDLIEDEDFDKSCEGDLTQDGLNRLERIFDKYTAVYEKVIFIVDSLQQVASYLDTGKNGVDSILRVFKKWSATAPVVLVSTLNRAGYSKETGEINMADLKESGSLEYNTDLLVTMVPLGFVDKSLNEDLKAFKSKNYREIMLTCKKSRDSAEKDQKITLYAPGCTFIPYEDKETAESKKVVDVELPPANSLNWVGIA